MSNKPQFPFFEKEWGEIENEMRKGMKKCQPENSLKSKKKEGRVENTTSIND